MTTFNFDGDEEYSDLQDWRLPIVFNCNRHLENIVGCETDTQTWRMKERMKTVSVALILCLNVGVDPPDIIKTQPCARMECWVDPLSIAPQKALDQIANALQKQYEKWQPRARYKNSLDPTVEEVKRLCTSMRRNAKDERILFHYNGHGVPKPTSNGEIWVFNKTYTQYIPLSIYDLQQWMTAPSIYVFDCSCAGLIVDSYKQFAAQHEREYEIFANNNKTSADSSAMPAYKSCILLAACGMHQILPMNPDLPADLFTSCLTTPVKTALTWFVLQNGRKLVPEITVEDIDKIPGLLNDRRTMLGELNWIFTAITDTIAWNVLPKDTFQRLFRQDLLVASLFRNFLLAERVMRSYNCNPVSEPSLPMTHHHPMWQAWDLAVDICLSQLPTMLKDPSYAYSQSPFFSEQLTAFQVWLSFGFNGHSVPEQLPIVLQVLLSQVHRLRALELLGRFLDLGPWAVNLALSVGIFPYVLKLLQSSARELRPLLVFIWAKVLAVDMTCQNDLVRDGGYKYFLCILGDPYMPADHRTMAAFAVTCIVKNYKGGQSAALQGNVVAICLEQLNDEYEKLRQWVAICLGCTWANFEQARWCGVRDSAHEKLYVLLSDPAPEVRACAVYALGTFLNSTTERTDHANAIDHNIGMTLINNVATDGSPLVRMELVVALQWFLLIFENQFVAVAYQYMEEEKLKETQINQHLLAPGGETPTEIKKVASRDRLKTPLSSSPLSGLIENGYHSDGSGMIPMERIRKVSSSTSLCSLSGTSPFSFTSIALGYASVFACIWRALINLSSDPFPDVAEYAEHLLNHIKTKVLAKKGIDMNKSHKTSSSISEPSSPSGKPNFLNGEYSPSQSDEIPTDNAQPPKGLQRWADINPAYQQYQYFAQFHRIRKTFDKGPEIRENGQDISNQPEPKSPIIETNLVAWCSKHFCQPIIEPSEPDPESDDHQEKEWRYIRNDCIRQGLLEDKKKLEISKLDEQVFINKNLNAPAIVKFHPYDPYLVVGDKESYSVWDWETGTQLCNNSSLNPITVRITALDLVNSHDDTLLMIGSDDGSVRIWRNYSGIPKLITGFQILQDLRPMSRGPGLVLDWEQQTSQIIASGDTRIIRIWDANKEAKIQDIVAGSDCVTSISCHANSPHIIAVGCGDGTVRTYDKRLPSTDCNLNVYHEHSGWVVHVSLKSSLCNENQVISGSVAGDVRFWDVRKSSSTSYIPPSHGMTAMTVHPNLDLIACGAASQFITVYNYQGENVSTIKYHDGFMSHRIGPISCLAFHPYKASLAAGSTDSFVSVYCVSKRH